MHTTTTYTIMHTLVLIITEVLLARVVCKVVDLIDLI